MKRLLFLMILLIGCNFLIQSQHDGNDQEEIDNTAQEVQDSVSVTTIIPNQTVDHLIRTIKPDPNIDFKLIVVKPDSTVDFKLRVAGSNTIIPRSR